MWDFAFLHFAQYISISPHGIDCKQTWCKKIYRMDKVSWLKPLSMVIIWTYANVIHNNHYLAYIVSHVHICYSYKLSIISNNAWHISRSYSSSMLIKYKQRTCVGDIALTYDYGLQSQIIIFMLMKSKCVKNLNAKTQLKLPIIFPHCAT